DRLSNAGDIVRYLTGHSPVSGGHTTSTRLRTQKKQPRSKALTLGVVAAIVVAAAGIALWTATRGSTAPGVAKAQVDSQMVVVHGGMYTIGSDTGPRDIRPAHRV